jgi:hypothetical protein
MELVASVTRHYQQHKAQRAPNCSEEANAYLRST